MPESPDTLIELTTKIISAHVSNNEVTADELPALIRQVYDTLGRVSRNELPLDTRSPAVPVKSSIRSDGIVCLECGDPFKMLKRHLMSHHGMSPEQYRQKWALSATYPMVAANYAKVRSALAKRIGLGTRHMTPAGKAKRRIAAANAD